MFNTLQFNQAQFNGVSGGIIFYHRDDNPTYEPTAAWAGVTDPTAGWSDEATQPTAGWSEESRQPTAGWTDEVQPTTPWAAESQQPTTLWK